MEEVATVDTIERREAREHVRWVEEQVPLMDSAEYLEWFDGPGRAEYVETAQAAGLGYSE